MKAHKEATKLKLIIYDSCQSLTGRLPENPMYATLSFIMDINVTFKKQKVLASNKTLLINLYPAYCKTSL